MESSPTATKATGMGMDFYQALKEIAKGERVTKLEWNEESIYCCLRDGILKIFMSGTFRDWIIQEADMVGTDWVVLPRVAQV